MERELRDRSYFILDSGHHYTVPQAKKHNLHSESSSQAQPNCFPHSGKPRNKVIYYRTRPHVLPNTLLQARYYPPLPTYPPSNKVCPQVCPPPPNKEGVCSHLSVLFSRQTILCCLSSSSYCNTFDLATSTKWASCLF